MHLICNIENLFVQYIFEQGIQTLAFPLHVCHYNWYSSSQVFKNSTVYSAKPFIWRKVNKCLSTNKVINSAAPFCFVHRVWCQEVFKGASYSSSALVITPSSAVAPLQESHFSNECNSLCASQDPLSPLFCSSARFSLSSNEWAGGDRAISTTGYCSTSI